ncbi:MAG: cytochrome c biogenesis protein CcsA [Armatimonadota bacterium]
MERLRKILLIVGIPLATFHSYLVPDAANFQSPEFARIFFWHFPCPIMATLLICMGLYFSMKYLQTHDEKWDIRSSAVHELAMIFIVLTMISGIFFSRIQWLAWWQNDPRQVSFLLVMVIYLAYFVLRTAFTDTEKRATNSAGYAIAAFLPFLFLTFVYPRLPQILGDSFHPTDTIMKGNLKGGYAWVTIELMILVSIITNWIYNLRSRAGILELEVENYGHDIQNTRRSTTDTPVVRRISVSDES